MNYNITLDYEEVADRGNNFGLDDSNGTIQFTFDGIQEDVIVDFLPYATGVGEIEVFLNGTKIGEFSNTGGDVIAEKYDRFILLQEDLLATNNVLLFDPVGVEGTWGFRNIEIVSAIPCTDYGVNPNVEMRILEAKFGDGYSQRIGDGLNTQNVTFGNSWTVRSYRHMSRLYEYLLSKGGYQSFPWVDDSGELNKCHCKKFSKPKRDGYGVYSMNAEFVKVYDL